MPNAIPQVPGSPPIDLDALKKKLRSEVLARVQSRGHFDHGDIADLRQNHTDDEAAQTLADYFATPPGQQEMAKAGKGGADPKELARDVMRGR